MMYSVLIWTNQGSGFWYLMDLGVEHRERSEASSGWGECVHVSSGHDEWVTIRSRNSIARAF